MKKIILTDNTSYALIILASAIACYLLIYIPHKNADAISLQNKENCGRDGVKYIEKFRVDNLTTSSRLELRKTHFNTRQVFSFVLK